MKRVRMRKDFPTPKIIVVIFLTLILSCSYTLEANTKDRTQFIKTCDSINFMAIQSLVSKASKKGNHTLDDFKYSPGQKVDKNFKTKTDHFYITGISELGKKGFKNGMLLKFLSYYPEYKEFKDLAEKIEKEKKNLKNKINGPKTYKRYLADFIHKVEGITKNYNGYQEFSEKLKSYVGTTMSSNKPKSEPALSSKKDQSQTSSQEVIGNSNNSNQENTSGLKTDTNNVNISDLSILSSKVDSLNEVITDLNDEVYLQSADIDNNKSLNYLALGLIFITIIVLILYYIVNNRKSRRDAKHQEMLGFLKRDTFPHYDNEINDIKSKMDNVRNELEELKRSLSLFVTRIESIQQNIETTTVKQNIVEKPQEERYVPPPVQKYYLPFPDRQGYFWDDKKSEDPANNSFYVLEVEPKNPERGTITLYLQNEKNIRTALTNASSFLKPVCDEVSNNFNGNTINMIEKGELLLQSGKWNVVGGKKIKIKIS